MKTQLLRTLLFTLCLAFPMVCCSQYKTVSFINNNPAALSSSPNNNGYGVKFAFYTGSLSIKPFSPNDSMDFRFGVSYGFSFLGSKVVKDIPLLAPQTGNAAVYFNNYYQHFDYHARFSRPNFCYSYIEPYIDLSMGVAIYSSKMEVAPNDSSYSNTTTTLHDYSAFKVGIETGCFIKITPAIKIDIALNKSFSPITKAWTDLSTVSKEKNTVVYCDSRIPKSVTQLSVGIVFAFAEADNQSKNPTYEFDDTYTPRTRIHRSSGTNRGIGRSLGHSSSHSSGSSRVSTGSCNCGGNSK